jgi:hypothetical protein
MLPGVLDAAALLRVQRHSPRRAAVPHLPPRGEDDHRWARCSCTALIRAVRACAQHSKEFMRGTNTGRLLPRSGPDTRFLFAGLEAHEVRMAAPRLRAWL